ncbi:MAG: GMC family oxidoreductase N-terminal domain-containing protein, partial [Microcoleaceae cyanobacterium]
MIIDDQHYDIIVIGTGAGGGTIVHKLAPTGKKILILERGDSMPLEEQNRTNVDVFKRERYHAPEQWYDSMGEPFSPQMNYAVGGNTKIYGAVLQRMRQRDFEAVQHQEGISPEWCLKYSDFELYYSEAEQLYMVHGNAADDPTEPTHSQDYPYPAIDHEPCIQELTGAIAKQNLHPTPLPLTLTRQDDDPTGDSEVFGIEPVLKLPNVTLVTSAKVVSLHTNSSGQQIKGVQVEIEGKPHLFLCDLVVLACGAINSAALLLQSVNEKHPNGLANGSGLVGRNLMKHLMTEIVQRDRKSNSGTFRRSLSLNDFYRGDDNFDYHMRHI